MKSYLDRNGIIHIEAETEVEAYALKTWLDKNGINDRVDKIVYSWGLKKKPTYDIDKVLVCVGMGECQYKGNDDSCNLPEDVTRCRYSEWGF